MATLKLKNINKIYPNKVQAVFDFNLDIKDKEFIVFVGPSGCGKSTTLRMIAGLEDISSGEFYIDGELMNMVEPKDRNIAMVFQSYALYPHMTVYGNMEFALKLRKIRKPVYKSEKEIDPEIAKQIKAIRAENKTILNQIKALDRKFKKNQNDISLLPERTELFKQLFDGEAKIESLSVPVVGQDKELIRTLTKQLKKVIKEIKRNERSLVKYEAFPEKYDYQSLADYVELQHRQVEDLISKIEYYKNNDVNIMKSRHLTRYERKLDINRVAASIDLVRYLYRKPAALSGGQRQRVALGRAIVRKPKVFLMDEPLSNLDAKLRVQTRSEIAKIHQDVGATTIYVTHDQTEALTLADRIVIMKDGYIQQIGTPKEVYADPANKFVGGFIGSPAMNFIRGKVEGGVFKAIATENAQGNTFELKLDQKSLKLLQNINDEVYLGIRPEDIYTETTVADGLSECVTLDIEYTELLGKEHVIYCLGSGQRIIMKTDDDIEVSRGGVINVKIDTNKLYFFSTQDEMRIR